MRRDTRTAELCRRCGGPAVFTAMFGPVPVPGRYADATAAAVAAGAGGRGMAAILALADEREVITRTDLADALTRPA